MEPGPVLDQSRQLLAIVDRLVAELRSGGHSAATLDSQLDKDLGVDSLARIHGIATAAGRLEVFAGLQKKLHQSFRSAYHARQIPNQS